MSSTWKNAFPVRKSEKMIKVGLKNSLVVTDASALLEHSWPLSKQHISNLPGENICEV